MEFLLYGLFLGLVAGVSPGPLLTLVIAESLKHGKKQGIKVAITPLIADTPIIIFSFFLISKLQNFDTILGIISFVGAAFVMYLGYESLTTKGLDINVKKGTSKSFKKGILAATLNPYPYLFWLTVGIPILLKSYKVNLFYTIFFLASFYIMIVGSKITIAILVDKSRKFLKEKIYLWTMRVLGILLLIFALMFINEGLKHFGILLF